MNKRDEHQLETTDSPADGEQPQKTRSRSSRMPIWWGVCGLYLLYLAYNLLQGYLNGEAQTTRDIAVCLGGAAAFAIIAAVLLVMAVRQGLRSMRESAEDMRRVAEEDRLEAERRAAEEAEDDEDWEDGEDLPEAPAEDEDGDSETPAAPENRT